MNVDGTGVTRLTNHQRRVSAFPTWSPNGQKIAFMEHTLR